MTGNEVKTIRTKGVGETQTVFALRLGYTHYQAVLRLEKRGKKPINAVAEKRIRDRGLEQYLAG